MRPWTEYVQVMISLFAMCTAPALIPVFLGMTSAMSESQRKRSAFRVAVTVVVTLAIMIFFGERLFQLMGINIHAFEAGGGVIIFLSALKMLNSDPPELEASDLPAQHTNDPTIVPLAIPTVVGPGLLTAMLIQSAKYQGFGDDLVLLGTAFTMGFYVLVSFLAGEKLVKWLGASGLSVMTKLSGLLLSAIAVEFIVAGLLAMMPSPRG